MNITFEIEVDRSEPLFNESTLDYLELSLLVPTSMALAVILFCGSMSCGVDMKWYLTYKEELYSYVASPRLISTIGFISVMLYGCGVITFNKTTEEWGGGVVIIGSGGALENIPVLDRHALFLTVLVLSYLIFGLYIGWILLFFKKMPPESCISSSSSSNKKPQFIWILRRKHEVLSAIICLVLNIALSAVTVMITFFVTYKSFLLMTPYLVWICYLLFLTVSYFFFLKQRTPSVV